MMSSIPVVVGAICAALPPTVAAIAALVVALRTDKKVTEVHVTLNGRLTELLKFNQAAAHAEGRLQGREEEQAKATTPTPPTVI